MLAGCGGSSTPDSGTDSGGVPTSPGAPSDGGGTDDGDGDTDDGGTDGGGTDDGGDNPDDGKDGDGDPSDKPVVISTDPEPQSATVSSNAIITIVFDDELDTASATQSHVTLTGPAGLVDIDIDVTDNKLILKPQIALTGGASYTATVNAGIRNSAGNTMDADYSWQFVVKKAIAGVCSSFYGLNFALIEGKNPTSWKIGVPKPGRGLPAADPVYGSCITRATSAQSEVGVGWMRNDYSRRQAFNADDSRFLTLGRYGRWFIHKTSDTSIVRELSISGGALEPQWHPTDPELMYVFDDDGSLRINLYNVKTSELKTVADLGNVAGIHGYPGLNSIKQVWSTAARAWTRWEGAPSKDARHWGLMVETSGGNGLGLVTYDMATNTITGVYDYAKNGVGTPDHVSMSPSGKYILPSWDSPRCPSTTQLGTRNNPCGLMSFTADFSSAVGLSAESPHSDIGIDANGRDVIITSDYQDGWVQMLDVATGTRTPLWYMWQNSNGTALHVSAKNYNKPGWVLISTYAERSPIWFARKIMAVEMKANPRILNIAHTYNAYSTYWTEPHATVNRDFTRIMFNSNWGTGNEDMDVYMITLPPNAVPMP